MRLSFPKLAILRPAPIRKRLWQGGVALAAVLATFIIGNMFISDEKAVSSRMLGHDFMAFYTAGTFARAGEFEKLYDLEATRQFQHELAAKNGLEIGKSFGPYWNPPFYAWLPALFAGLPYPKALAAWTLMNVVCLGVAVTLMVKMLPSEPRDDWKIWILIPLLIITCMPFVQAISHAQNTFLSLMLLSLVVTAWRKHMPVIAGMVCGLMFYKPQLAAVVAGMLFLSLGIRVCIGFGFVLGSSMLLMGATMPNALGTYLTQLPLNLHFMQIENTYLWERHVTLRAFWRLLYQGRDAGETILLVNVLTLSSILLIGAGLLFAWYRTKTHEVDDCWTGETRAASLDRLIVATIVSMPLLMPFYFDYDLLLLSIPAALTAGEVLSIAPGGQMDRMQRLLVGVWTALYAWMMINPLVASAGSVNVAVVLLGALGGLSIARASLREREYPPLRIHLTYPSASRCAA